MTRLAQTERSELCDLALQLGEDQPTLCGDWTVKDLVVHLVLRERSPAAVGILVPPLSGLTDVASRRLERTDFAVLVERLRGGPPRWSPVSVPPVDTAVNTLEYLVHHEDVRRAQPGWTSRDLSASSERAVWRALHTMAKLLARRVPAGVVLEDSLSGSRLSASRGAGRTVVRGRPSEIALYLFGRKDQADVQISGDAPEAVEETPLGL
jgi:uncharacterized protein (TIGR03085 family)